MILKCSAKQSYKYEFSENLAGFRRFWTQQQLNDPQMQTVDGIVIIGTRWSASDQYGLLIVFGGVGGDLVKPGWVHATT